MREETRGVARLKFIKYKIYGCTDAQLKFSHSHVRPNDVQKQGATRGWTQGRGKKRSSREEARKNLENGGSLREA